MVTRVILSRVAFVSSICTVDPLGVAWGFCQSYRCCFLQILYSVFTGVEVHDPHARHQYDHHHLCMRVTMAMFARAPYRSYAGLHSLGIKLWPGPYDRVPDFQGGFGVRKPLTPKLNNYLWPLSRTCFSLRAAKLGCCAASSTLWPQVAAVVVCVQVPVNESTHTHTYTRTHTHTHTPAHTHTHPHTHTHNRAHTHTLTPTHAHTHTHTLTLSLSLHIQHVYISI